MEWPDCTNMIGHIYTHWYSCHLFVSVTRFCVFTYSLVVFKNNIILIGHCILLLYEIRFVLFSYNGPTLCCYVMIQWLWCYHSEYLYWSILPVAHIYAHVTWSLVSSGTHMEMYMLLLSCLDCNTMICCNMLRCWMIYGWPVCVI